jgi:short-subunit dehydrogenase
MPAQRRVALITGATRGIGLAFAREYALAHHNKDLILVGRTESELRSLAKQLQKTQGGRIEIIVADLTSRGTGDAIAEQVQAFGMKVDVLVNAASLRLDADFIDADPDTTQARIALHCNAMVDLCHAFAAQMVAQRFGSIINVAAAAGSRPRPYSSVAGATSAFTLSFTQALRAELRPFGLRIVAVCPASRDLFPRAAETSMETLVRRSLSAVRNNRATVVPGWRDAAIGLLVRLLPTRFFAALIRRNQQRR